MPQPSSRVKRLHGLYSTSCSRGGIAVVLNRGGLPPQRPTRHLCPYTFPQSDLNEAALRQADLCASLVCQNSCKGRRSAVRWHQHERSIRHMLSSKWRTKQKTYSIPIKQLSCQTPGPIQVVLSKMLRRSTLEPYPNTVAPQHFRSSLRTSGALLNRSQWPTI
jgi:hypothetical protein